MLFFPLLGQMFGRLTDFDARSIDKMDAQFQIASPARSQNISKTTRLRWKRMKSVDHSSPANENFTPNPIPDSSCPNASTKRFPSSAIARLP
jgi:hypothetical protein